MNCVYADKSTENIRCLFALEVPPVLCGVGNRFLRHMSGTSGKVKPPHPDFLRKFTSNSLPTSTIIPTYITVHPFSVGNLQRTKSPIFGSSLSQYLRLSQYLPTD